MHRRSTLRATHRTTAPRRGRAWPRRPRRRSALGLLPVAIALATWLPAAAVCVLLSLNAVTGAHAILAGVAASLTGWTALGNHAVWWLVPGGLVVGWFLSAATWRN